jgi:putative membrane protein
VTERVWDKGLQPERTALSWRRLSMIFLGVALLLPRVVWHLVGPWSLMGSGLLALLAVVLYTAGERRYGRTHRSLVDAGQLPDARLLAVSAAATVLLGSLGLVAVLGGPH